MSKSSRRATTRVPTPLNHRSRPCYTTKRFAKAVWRYLKCIDRKGRHYIAPVK